MVTDLDYGSDKAQQFLNEVYAQFAKLFRGDLNNCLAMAPGVLTPGKFNSKFKA